MCFEVPPDGNCGVYTVASLEDGQPGAGRCGQTITNVRVFISDAWNVAADHDPIWKKIFETETRMFDGSLEGSLEEDVERGKEWHKVGQFMRHSVRYIGAPLGNNLAPLFRQHLNRNVG